ncbi:response regulator [Methanoregula sp.]|uniref:response regulator n=1 Tax=Methanoregula sp. TaxID=2052170 RepID=UPI00344EDB24
MAKSGETALENAGETRPNHVLMDIRLSGTIDGIEAAGQIHARYGIPVIFLTACADTPFTQGVLQPCRQRGASRYHPYTGFVPVRMAQ